MMKCLNVILLSLVSVAAFARTPNYDESKVTSYELEDPLTFADGTRVKDAADWERRRQEIVGIFEHEMYGRTPPAPEAVVTELMEEGPTLAGLAIRRQYRMWFRRDKSGPFVDWLVVIPNRINGEKPQLRDGRVVCENKERCPVVVMLNYNGNHTLLDDPEIPLPENAWIRPEGGRGGVSVPLESERGMRRRSSSRAPMSLEYVTARGYALVTAAYCQVSPDAEDQWTKIADEKRRIPTDFAYAQGVFALWEKHDPSREDDITSIGAWAWALSRGLDLAYAIPEIDAEKSVATGFSRLGKAPLLACSRDTRFKVCVPNQTGGGGAPLAKRNFGENIGTEVVTFPHWYCKAYRKYADREDLLTFDQHLLLASIAPRALLVEGFNVGWFDTNGEYLACRAAAPVWAFLGKGTMPDVPFPDNYSTAAIGDALGYVRRGGLHGISQYDWQWTLDFADRQFKSARLHSEKGDLPWTRDYSADPAFVAKYREAAIAIAKRKMAEVDAGLKAHPTTLPVGRRLATGGGFGGLFLWDSAFFVLWARYLDEKDFPYHSTLDNFYVLATPSGFIPRQYTPEGYPCWTEQHPISFAAPVLSWAEIELYRMKKSDVARLKRVYPSLKRHHEACRKSFRRADGLYFGDPVGCGMDDLPRWPRGNGLGGHFAGAVPCAESPCRTRFLRMERLGADRLAHRMGLVRCPCNTPLVHCLSGVR